MTVDFIVLTAAIVGLGIGVVASVRVGVTSLAFSIETSLTGGTVAQVGALGFAAAGCSSGDPDPDGNNCSVTTPTRR